MFYDLHHYWLSLTGPERLQVLVNGLIFAALALAAGWLL